MKSVAVLASIMFGKIILWAGCVVALTVIIVLIGQSMMIVVRNGRAKMKLHDFMAQAKDGFTYSIGGRTGFFFIGTIVEYAFLIDKISEKTGFNIYDAEVIESYPIRIPNSIVVRIDSEIPGKYWFKNEFDKDWVVKNEDNS